MEHEMSTDIPMVTMSSDNCNRQYLLEEESSQADFSKFFIFILLKKKNN